MQNILAKRRSSIVCSVNIMFYGVAGVNFPRSWMRSSAYWVAASADDMCDIGNYHEENPTVSLIHVALVFSM